MSDTNSPKRATNVTIDAGLLREARALDINLSQTLETRLREIVAAKLREQWLQDNAKAIDAYNRRVDADGLFSDDFRSF